MSERPTTGMLPADYPMAECRICGHWSYMAGVLDDPVCLACRNQRHLERERDEAELNGSMDRGEGMP